MPNYDVIVVGLGALGCVAAHDLSARGLRVLGLDRFEPGHDRGSSHGETRVIRQAYFEHPDYVPLLRRAYERWADIETRTNRRLYHPVGVLEFGPEDGVVVPGVLRAAAQHQLQVEELSANEATQRFPGFSGLHDQKLRAVFERDAGYLLCEPSVRAWAAQARSQGAVLEAGAGVTGWSEQRGSFVVTTEAGSYQAEQLLLCPGAWAPGLLPSEVADHLRVRRKVLLWYGAAAVYGEDQGCPVWLFELPEGIFYGFPVRDDRGLKAARHSGGLEIADPMQVDRQLHLQDHQQVDRFLERHLKGVAQAQPREHAVCMYTMSPDEHFIVGASQAHPGLWYGAGLSGHGFKLVPALGELLAQGIASGKDSCPDIFSAERFQASP